MFKLNSLLRPNIQRLKQYQSARDEYVGKSGVFLDANENPYGDLNRYPDPNQVRLKKEFSKLKGVDPKSIFIGNGSDEILDLCFRLFCIPDKDKLLTFSPTYGMYDVLAELNSIEIIKTPLSDQFQIDLTNLKDLISNPKLKMILICSPNNPSGNCIDPNEIEYILKNFNGIVLIDEAYQDFNPFDSWVNRLNEFPNLIVLQTMSKAWGLAAARIGIGYSSKAIIALLTKIKAPYNVSELNQNAAIKALSNPDKYQIRIQKILDEREILKKALLSCGDVVKVYPSDSNFLLVEFREAEKMYSHLISQNIITRNRDKMVKNCIRITIGTSKENKQLIKAIKTIEK